MYLTAGRRRLDDRGEVDLGLRQGGQRPHASTGKGRGTSLRLATRGDAPTASGTTSRRSCARAMAPPPGSSSSPTRFSARNYCRDERMPPGGWASAFRRSRDGGAARRAASRDRVLDPLNQLQQEVLGLLGVNLLYGVFHQRGSADDLSACAVRRHRGPVGSRSRSDRGAEERHLRRAGPSGPCSSSTKSGPASPRRSSSRWMASGCRPQKSFSKEGRRPRPGHLRHRHSRLRTPPRLHARDVARRAGRCLESTDRVVRPHGRRTVRRWHGPGRCRRYFGASMVCTGWATPSCSFSTGSCIRMTRIREPVHWTPRGPVRNRTADTDPRFRASALLQPSGPDHGGARAPVRAERPASRLSDESVRTRRTPAGTGDRWLGRLHETDGWVTADRLRPIPPLDHPLRLPCSRRISSSRRRHPRAEASHAGISARSVAGSVLSFRPTRRTSGS